MTARNISWRFLRVKACHSKSRNFLLSTVLKVVSFNRLLSFNFSCLQSNVAQYICLIACKLRSSIFKSEVTIKPALWRLLQFWLINERMDGQLLKNLIIRIILLYFALHIHLPSKFLFVQVSLDDVQYELPDSTVDCNLLRFVAKYLHSTNRLLFVSCSLFFYSPYRQFCLCLIYFSMQTITIGETMRYQPAELLVHQTYFSWLKVYMHLSLPTAFLHIVRSRPSWRWSSRCSGTIMSLLF